MSTEITFEENDLGFTAFTIDSLGLIVNTKPRLDMWIGCQVLLPSDMIVGERIKVQARGGNVGITIKPPIKALKHEQD